MDSLLLRYEANHIQVRFRLHSGIKEGEQLKGILSIESTGIMFAAQWLLLDMEIHNKMFDVSECHHLEVEISNRQKEIPFVVPAEWCGETEINCTSVCIRDVLRLSKKKIRPFASINTVVFPRNVNVQVEMSTSTIGAPLDEGMMQNRKGNDPSEIFDIKDYTPGDDLRFVHWKLSGKVDHLIMRQPSEPTHYHAIILMDLGMEQDGQSVTRTELNGAAAVGVALCQEMIQQGAAFCVALPYKDGLSVNEIGSMREFQKIQMEWLGMPVQMNAGRGMDYFVLQHMEEHFTRLIIISAGRYSKDIVSLAQRIGVTVLSIVEDAGSTAGIVCSMLAHRLKDKYQLSVLILLAPWPAAFVLTGFCGCFEGLKAWINLMITQWNKVHEDSIALLSGNIVQHDLWASTVVIVLLCGEVTYFLITLRKYGFCALYCILWVMVQLFSSAFSPAACIGLFVPVVAVYISNQRTEMTHRGLLWVAGLTAVLVICAMAVPQEDMLSMAKAKSALKLSLSNMRYGQPTLPEGHVDEADRLKANENEMFTVTSEQKKIFISKAIQADGI